MLHAHRPLRPVKSSSPVRREHALVLQVRLRDHNRRSGRLLEAQLAVPGHVLDGQEGAVRDDDHVKVPVRDEHAVRRLDDLREDVLYRIGGEVAFAFRAAVVVAVDFGAADEDGIDGAGGPGDGLGRVDGGFDVRPVEVGRCAFGGVDELGGEGEHVPEQGALLVHFVDVEAGVVRQGGVVDLVEDIAVGFAGVVEEHGWLVAGGWEGEVFGAEVGVSAGFVEAFELGEEGGVELEEGLVLENKGYSYDLLLCIVELADNGVIY